MLALILGAAFLLIFLGVRLKTGTTYASDYNEKTGGNLNKRFYIGLAVISIVSFVLREIMIKNTILLEKEVNLISLLIFIIFIQYWDSAGTDPVLHVINRHTSRVAYISSLVVSSLIINTLYEGKSTLFIYLSIGIVLFIELLLLLFMRSLGPADVRNLMLATPALFALLGSWAMLGHLALLVSAMLYQFFREKVKGQTGGVPIGDKLLLPLPFILIWSVLSGNVINFLM